MDFDADTPVVGADMHLGHFPFTYNPREVLPSDIHFDFTPLSTAYGQWPFDQAFNQEPSWLSPNTVLPLSTTPAPISWTSGPQTQLRPVPPSQYNTQAAPTSAPTAATRKQEPSSPTSGRKRQQTQRPSTSRKVSTSRSSASPCDSNAAGPSARPHYAVEKRYRSTLNERYATLARIISQQVTVDICRTEVPDWEVPSKLEVPEPNSEKEPGKRQSKTTTLSVAIDTIDVLNRCCARKARELQSLVNKLSGIVSSMPGDFSDFDGQ